MTKLKYIHSRADRSGHLRGAEPSDLRVPEARLLPLWRGQSLIGGTESAPSIALIDAIPDGIDCPPIFLGEQAGHPLHAIDLSRLTEQECESLAERQGARFIDLRRVGPLLDNDEAALLSMARALVHWQATHRFCTLCGGPMLSKQRGHVLSCQRCKQDTFPRTDAAVIVLVCDAKDPDRCLLGRAHGWPEGVYSTLAGFVEPGESLEQAVEREILEETGISVTDIQYVASQPWPFPQSIMLGFEAKATTNEINCQEDEIDDARWFHRDEFCQFGEWHDDKARFRLPRRDSIARFLLQRWLDEG